MQVKRFFVRGVAKCQHLWTRINFSYFMDECVKHFRFTISSRLETEIRYSFVARGGVDFIVVANSLCYSLFFALFPSAFLNGPDKVLKLNSAKLDKDCQTSNECALVLFVECESHMVLSLLREL